MNRRFILKKSNQLSAAEKEQYLELFFRVFRKRMSNDQFDRKYLHTPTGYSYHGLTVIDGNIVGAYTAIPYLYKYFDQKLMFALSVDTMIDEQHRGGPFNLQKMATLVYDAMKEDGIAFILGFPNDKAYDVTKKVLKWKDIGELDYYVLPRNIGAIIPKMSFLNLFSRLFSKMKIALPRSPEGSESQSASGYNIQKIAGEEFNKHRYDGGYRTIKLGREAKCVYRTYVEDKRVSTVYIIDVNPLTANVFNKAIKQVYSVKAKSIDLIMYIGKLPFLPSCLVKLPESKKPRKIRMARKILLPEGVDDRIFTIDNWNVNLSNFDVR